MQAMILAAGFGTRLQPYTDHIPKPLFPILNKPLLLLLIARLKKAGFHHIIINCHHLREQIVEAVSSVEGVIIQEEQSILGTGGGLKKAVQHMLDEPLLVTNADIYHTIPFDKVYKAHLNHDHEVTMVMHDFPRFNGVIVEDDRIKGFGKSENQLNRLAFTGIHVIEPKVLDDLITDTYSCIIDTYKRMLSSRKKIQSFRADEFYWKDMGTVKDYLDLHGELIAGKVPCWEELDISHKTMHLAKAKIRDRIACNDWCVVGENVAFDGECTLERSIVWKNAKVKKGIYSDTIII